MPFQSFHETFTLPILIRLGNKCLKALLQESAPAVIDLRTKSLEAQAQSVLHHPFELLGEGHPLRGSVKDTGADQVSEEMKETPLFQEGTDLVIGAKEVADQHPLKELSQDLFEHRGGSGGRDEVISDLDLFTGEAPKPVGFAQNPPSSFINMEERTGPDQPLQRLIPGQKDVGQSLPGQGQTARRDREMQAAIEVGHDLPKGKPQVKVQIGRMNQEAIPEGAFR